MPQHLRQYNQYLLSQTKHTTSCKKENNVVIQKMSTREQEAEFIARYVKEKDGQSREEFRERRRSGLIIHHGLHRNELPLDDRVSRTEFHRARERLTDEELKGILKEHKNSRSHKLGPKVEREHEHRDLRSWTRR